MQIRVFELENRLDIPFHSRFPFFTALHWFWLANYVNHLLEKQDRESQTHQYSTGSPVLSSSKTIPNWERKGLIAISNFLPQYNFLIPDEIVRRMTASSPNEFTELPMEAFADYFIAVVRAYLKDQCLPSFSQYLRNRGLYDSQSQIAEREEFPDVIELALKDYVQPPSQPRKSKPKLQPQPPPQQSIPKKLEPSATIHQLAFDAGQYNSISRNGKTSKTNELEVMTA